MILLEMKQHIAKFVTIDFFPINVLTASFHLVYITLFYLGSLRRKIDPESIKLFGK